MKVIVCNDQDALMLRLQFETKQRELAARFRQQSQEHERVVAEVFRAVNYVLVEWLQKQGFGAS